MHGSQLPLSRELVIALALGFGLFNQVLFGALGAALAAEGRGVVGDRLLLVSSALGGLLLSLNVIFLLGARTFRWTDMGALAPAALVAAAAAWRALTIAPAEAAWLLLGANGWIACWLSRGWVRRFLARRSRRERDGAKQGSSDLTASRR